MRMPADELFGDRLDHVAEIERALFLGHAGVEDDLEQEIAQFFLEIGEIVARDGVGDLVGFLDACTARWSRNSAPGPTDSRSAGVRSAAMISRGGRCRGKGS